MQDGHVRTVSILRKSSSLVHALSSLSVASQIITNIIVLVCDQACYHSLYRPRSTGSPTVWSILSIFFLMPNTHPSAVVTQFTISCADK